VLDVGRELSTPRAGLKTWSRALRVHQWSKNLLVFVPALLSIPLLTTVQALNTLMAFVALCAVASATYVVNDVADMPHDR